MGMRDGHATCYTAMTRRREGAGNAKESPGVSDSCFGKDRKNKLTTRRCKRVLCVFTEDFHSRFAHVACHGWMRCYLSLPVNAQARGYSTVFAR